MAKITKRIVDALEPRQCGDAFAWDSELRGFGIRVKPSGVKPTSSNIGTPRAGRVGS